MSKTKSVSRWRSRIVGYSEEPPDQLLAHPLNWRVHGDFQKEALTGVLDEVGVVQNVVVNKTTQHVIDGHLRISLALQQGQPTVPVTWIEVSEEEEHLLLASLDPISALAVADPDQFTEVLSQFSTGDAALQQMLDEMALDGEMRSLITGAGSEGARELGDRRKQVKVVLYVDQLAIFEDAILAVGNPNRGEALVEICQEYLNNAERQFDIQAEGRA